jgi:uncharacterized repeat protein (TIGR03803 family)
MIPANAPAERSAPGENMGNRSLFCPDSRHPGGLAMTKAITKRNWPGWKLPCAISVLCLATVLAAPAQTTFKTILNFNGTNGSAPTAALVQGLDGNLYGVAGSGGKNGEGTVFKITTEGKLTTLYNFCSKTNCADGEFPQGSLLLATNGNFYGTTKFGGATCSLNSSGCGTIFEITPEGKLTTLYTFCENGGENCADGANPEAPLIEGTNGDFYGTTFFGGNSNDAGTAFEITAAGKLTTIYTFCSKAGEDCPDGSNPNGVILGTNGKFYGSTQTGGGVPSSIANESNDCFGLLFELQLEGEDEFELIQVYDLCVDSGADFPSGLTQSAAEPPNQKTKPPTLTFYGTSSGGGTHAGGANLGGTVFSVTSAHKLTVLHDFCAEAKCADGAAPSAGVVEGTDGNFYGTTAGGGNRACVDLDGCGTVFMITPQGTLTSLHLFDKTDGDDPVAGLVQATDGTFYGTTFEEGPGGSGTIFSISTGLEPFVRTVPTIGAVGSTVTILGTDLTAASSVTFNGTATDFKVVSATEITTTVPSGATTGSVEVTTPKGTLKSFPFTVS